MRQSTRENPAGNLIFSPTNQVSETTSGNLTSQFRQCREYKFPTIKSQNNAFPGDFECREEGNETQNRLEVNRLLGGSCDPVQTERVDSTDMLCKNVASVGITRH
jgi:hypothetical protein